MFPLETERLWIRRFREADAAAFAAYRSDPEVARWQGWNIPYPLAQAEEFVREMAQVEPGTPGRWLQLALELKLGGELIGDCAFELLDDPRQANIGLTLARPFWSQGYGEEAARRLLDYLFMDLGLHRVRADTDVENAASIRLLERLGLRREAHLIENIWFKGAWGSEYWYAMLEREYQAISSKL